MYFYFYLFNLLLLNNDEFFLFIVTIVNFINFSLFGFLESIIKNSFFF